MISGSPSAQEFFWRTSQTIQKLAGCSPIFGVSCAGGEWLGRAVKSYIPKIRCEHYCTGGDIKFDKGLHIRAIRKWSGLFICALFVSIGLVGHVVRCCAKAVLDRLFYYIGQRSRVSRWLQEVIENFTVKNAGDLNSNADFWLVRSYSLTKHLLCMLYVMKCFFLLSSEYSITWPQIFHVMMSK